MTNILFSLEFTFMFKIPKVLVNRFDTIDLYSKKTVRNEFIWSYMKLCRLIDLLDIVEI